MPIQSGQTYHIVRTAENIVVLEPHPKAVGFWFTAMNQKRHIPIQVEAHVQQGLWTLSHDSTIAYAWYSAQADQDHGSWAVVNVAGKVVRATAINSTLQCSYNWADKVYVGEVYADTHHDERPGVLARHFPTLTPVLLSFPNPTIGRIVGQALDNVTHTKPAKPLQLGEICPVCNKEWKRRELFIGAYVGCWCPTEG